MKETLYVTHEMVDDLCKFPSRRALWEETKESVNIVYVRDRSDMMRYINNEAKPQEG